MKTKQFLCGVLATLMLATSCFSASAAQITNSGEAGQTLVTYGMNQGFIVTIPTDFTIDDSGESTADVSASNVMIPFGRTLEVAISGHDYTNKWELIDIAEDDNRLEYTIGTSVRGRDIINNSIVLKVPAGVAYNSVITETMHFAVVDKLTKSGVYKDTLTFNVGLSAIAEGDGQIYDVENPTTLSFRSQQPIDEFQHVLLNNEIVDPDNYTVTEGSTIVTFKEEFLNTLIGKVYRLTFVFEKTTTTATFTVISNVSGGDDNESGDDVSTGLSFSIDGRKVNVGGDKEERYWGEFVHNDEIVGDDLHVIPYGPEGTDLRIMVHINGVPTDKFLVDKSGNYISPNDLVIDGYEYQYLYNNSQTYFYLDDEIFIADNENGYNSWGYWVSVVACDTMNIVEYGPEMYYIEKYENGQPTGLYLKHRNGDYVNPGEDIVNGGDYIFVEMNVPRYIDFYIFNDPVRVSYIEDANVWGRAVSEISNIYDFRIVDCSLPGYYARIEKYENNMPTNEYLAYGDGSYVQPGDDIIAGYSYGLRLSYDISFVIDGEHYGVEIDNQEYYPWGILTENNIFGSYELVVKVVGDNLYLEKYENDKATGYYLVDSNNRLIYPGENIENNGVYIFVKCVEFEIDDTPVMLKDSGSYDGFIWAEVVESSDFLYDLRIVPHTLPNEYNRIEKYENGQPTGQYVVDISGDRVEPGEQVAVRGKYYFRSIDIIKFNVNGVNMEVEDIEGINTWAAWDGISLNGQYYLGIIDYNGEKLIGKYDYTTREHTGDYVVDESNRPVRASEKPVNGEEYKFAVINNNRTISFSVDGISCSAEEGMTWNQWIDSQYDNVGYLYVSDEDRVCVKSEFLFLWDNQSDDSYAGEDIMVYGTEEIAEGFIYYSGSLPE